MYWRYNVELQSGLIQAATLIHFKIILSIQKEIFTWDVLKSTLKHLHGDQENVENEL